MIDLDQFIRRSTVPRSLIGLFRLVAILLLNELSRLTAGYTSTFIVVGFLLYISFPIGATRSLDSTSRKCTLRRTVV